MSSLWERSWRLFPCWEISPYNLLKWAEAVWQQCSVTTSPWLLLWAVQCPTGPGDRDRDRLGFALGLQSTWCWRAEANRFSSARSYSCPLHPRAARLRFFFLLCGFACFSGPWSAPSLWKALRSQASPCSLLSPPLVPMSSHATSLCSLPCCSCSWLYQEAHAFGDFCF